MTQLKISATKRGVGKKGRSELPEGSVPGVVYGREFKSTPIAVQLKDVTKSFHEAGTNRIIQMDLDGKEQDVLFKDIQYDPLTDNIRHFDLYAIKKGEKIKADIPVEAVGESQAVILGANLAQYVDTVEVESIPSKLPEKFVLDISSINEIGDSLQVSDIDIPEGVELLTDPESTIFRAEEIREMVVEEEEPEGEEEAEGEEGEAEESTEAAEGSEKSETESTDESQ